MNDLNLIRSIVTVLAFIAFLVLVLRVWRRSERERYDEAAALPFADEAGDATRRAGPPQAGPGNPGASATVPAVREGTLR